MADAVRSPMEVHISEQLGRPWRIAQAVDRTDEASHPAAVLSDGIYPVFVKLVENERAWDEVQREVDGLRLLTGRSGVLTPAVVGTIRFDQSVVLILEAVEVQEKQDHHWRQIGRALAQIHQAKGRLFGLEVHSYWGSLRLENTQHEDWVEFFRSRRLLPRLEAAFNSGNLPKEIIPLVEKVSLRLPDLCGPAVVPTLLHGDAHYNNILSTSNGPVFIDPTIYYGHPEIDLASMDFFELAFAGFFPPIPESFWQGYQEISVIDPGFVGRRDLWRLPAWLAMVELDGPKHVDFLKQALRNYV